MIFREPPLTDADSAVLDLIQRQRSLLRMYTQNNPRRWFGSLRRTTLARAVQGSNSIEGYDASLDDAVAVVDGELPLDPRTETYLALLGYRQALTYVLQTVRDPAFEMSEQFLKSLHFMMIQHEMKRNPGQYRPGSISVISERTDSIVYIAPDRDHIEPLMAELVDYLRYPQRSPAEVRGAMAHLNLTMIHPFSDGNGRMARAVQTLVLAREGGHLDPIFASIEEWLGQNTEAYYSVLGEVGQGAWHPERDPSPWVRFCLKAHYQQAATVVRRNAEYSALYEQIEQLRERKALNTRCVMPVFEAALGLTITNSRYQSLAEVEANLASRDLKMLVEEGLFVPQGEKRGRKYRAGDELRKLRRESRQPAPTEDPYEVIRKAGAPPRLPGF